MISLVHRNASFWLVGSLAIRTNEQTCPLNMRAQHWLSCYRRCWCCIFFVCLSAAVGVILAVGIVASAVYTVLTFCRFSSSFLTMNWVWLTCHHRKSICYSRLKSNNMKILRKDANILSSECVQSRWLYLECLKTAKSGSWNNNNNRKIFRLLNSLSVYRPFSLCCFWSSARTIYWERASSLSLIMSVIQYVSWQKSPWRVTPILKKETRLYPQPTTKSIRVSAAQKRFLPYAENS